MKKKSNKITKAGDITPSSYNPRTITPEQLESLGATMAEFGDLSGIVVNIKTGNCVSGHQRLKNIDPEWSVTKHAASDKTGTVALGSIQTPWGDFVYREVNWPEEKEKAANLAANKSGGEFDYTLVGEMLKDLDGKIDLGLTGFAHDEVLSILEGVNAPVDVEPLLDPSEAVNFNIRCANRKEMEKIQKRLGLTGDKTTFEVFMEALDTLCKS